ncbi:MAG TPA: hypothetical protein VGY54_12605 [Polyangiaceae bacterium]|nr:hypothetical protein [Polyangiaceae bacterium]
MLALAPEEQRDSQDRRAASSGGQRNGLHDFPPGQQIEPDPNLLAQRRYARHAALQ